MIDYPARYRAALLWMVRGLLDEAAEAGLPGEHAFYLTFDASAPDVGLSPTLRDVYPESMTIVIQHQFWDLETDDEGFSVTLRFGGRPESIFVPWPALLSFVDPSAEFGLELPDSEETADGAPDPGDQEAGDPEDASVDDEADVVSLDRFRDAQRSKVDS